MAVIKSLQTALEGIKTNPVLFLGGLILGLIVLPQTVAQLAEIPLLPLALQVLTFFITPFILAGIYGMADEAVESDTSRTSLSTLKRVGRDKYIPLLLATIVDLGIMIPFIFVFTILGIVGVFALGFGTVATGSDLALSGGVIALLLFVAVVLLVYLIVMLVIQFFPVAVVAKDAGAIESFGKSYRLVRENILATIGYSLVRFTVGFILSLPTVGLGIFLFIQETQSLQSVGGTPETMSAATGLSMVEIAGFAAISLVTQMVLTAFNTTYAVAFYEAHDSGSSTPSGPDIDGDAAIPQFE
ncbi:hypothetical protein C440_14174 [Haloferax mucosum ATCC BAA-1512]|uniref:DUF7847 domain-containing protein n=1 Tax=Haloferax mucosum ATCC BAA-1512 TaxID=662479 RepID=M0I673_9EURY|nr:hypothetical protein [Haloferax mucosum]ELZ91467.1 hypothetical protein C440_14174 [Haloferax mucosum ATCC BAA-1512]